MHRDLVEVAVQREGKRPGRQRSAGATEDRFEGEVLRILEHRLQTVVGRFERSGKRTFVVPDDDRLPKRIGIPTDGTGGARHGQDVVVRILTYPESAAGFTGKIHQILGQRGELNTEIEAVLHHHDLPLAFPPDVLAAADTVAASEAPPTEQEGRKALQHVPFVTIDGESAKDFDDAVTVEAASKGCDRVRVAIADVSHYVPAGSVIDEEALQRGTSAYFPDRVLPMLPPVLSDDLCSLRPGALRRTLVAEFIVDAEGAVGDTRFYRAVIRSQARLTYTIVHALLEQKDATTRAEYAVHLPMLERLATVCRRLRTHRLQRGSIDFDLPEPEILLDIAGGPEAILRAPRYFAHQMIEELMIAANEAVARHITDHKRPCVYRVHQEPDGSKMRELRLLLEHLEIPARISQPVRPGELAQVVQRVEGKPYTRLVNHTILRSMQQARYDLVNSGHFGLASTCYCHFTSPIRRYPDLVVHRVLTAMMSSAPLSPVAEIHHAARHASRRERVALDAEREMVKVYRATFLRDHIGDQFEGIVAHVTKRGLAVELTEFFVEGWVPLERLGPERYRYDEKRLHLRGGTSGRILQIGDAVSVQVAEVSMIEREVLFDLVS